MFKVAYKNKLVRSGHTREETDLIVNNMYYLIRMLIENLDRNYKTKMIDCYIYTRVSTSQVTEGHGLDSQLEMS